MYQFLSGAIAMSSLTISFFFIRFWKRTFDRLFLYFSVAFAIFASERVMLSHTSPDHEFQPFIYLFRCLAFIVIIAGILDKNMKK